MRQLLLFNSSDQQIIHTTKQEFIIDGQDGIIEPLGMSGVRLEVKVNIISSSTSSLQNIIKCLEGPWARS